MLNLDQKDWQLLQGLLAVVFFFFAINQAYYIYKSSNAKKKVEEQKKKHKRSLVSERIRSKFKQDHDAGLD